LERRGSDQPAAEGVAAGWRPGAEREAPSAIGPIAQARMSLRVVATFALPLDRLVVYKKSRIRWLTSRPKQKAISQCPSFITLTPTDTAGGVSTNTATDTAGYHLRAGRSQLPRSTGSRSTLTSTPTRQTSLLCWFRQLRDGDAMAPTRPALVHIEKRDARQALAALPPRSISVLITDPPYTTVARRGNSGHLKRWFARSLSWREIGQTLALARSRMRPDGVAFVMTNPDGLREAIEALERAGLVRVRPITWDKVAPGLGGGLRHRTEFVLVGYLPGSRTLSGADLVSVPAVGPGTANRYPTEKPADLGRELARIAGVGRRDFVVDPFCGSGALLIGAAERGAKVAGYDVAAAAVKRATGRLAKPIAKTPPKAPAPARKATKPSLVGRRTAGPTSYRNSARGAKPSARRARP
jgi:site-specific DNA-methyltransferase (adenine-specific)